MRRMFRAATVVAAAGVGLLGGSLPATSTASVAPAEGASTKAVRGVCQGVRHCQVVGRFDVNGNGRKDQVGLVNHDRDGYIRKGRVTVRVKTDRGRLVKQRVLVRNWKGAVWFGKAAINGRAGKEIVLGANRQKYVQEDPFPGNRVSFAKSFHVITFSPGSDLTRLRAPGGAKLWSLTSPNGVRSGSGSAQLTQEWGWWRKNVAGEVRMAKRMLSVGGAAGVRGRQTVWAWRHGQWRKLSSRAFSDPLNKNYGGWHVKGLRVW